MSILEDDNNIFEARGIIEDLYYLREDQIINIPRENQKSISLDELAKLPEDILLDVVEKLKDRPISKLDVKENTQEDNYMYKQFYTIGFKDGLNAILESIK